MCKENKKSKALVVGYKGLLGDIPKRDNSIRINTIMALTLSFFLLF